MLMRTEQFDADVAKEKISATFQKQLRRLFSKNISQFAMLALTLDEQSTPNNPNEELECVRTLHDTILLTEQTKLPVFQYLQESIHFSFNQVIYPLWGEGIYTLEIAWQEEPKQLARLYEVGIHVEEYNNEAYLIISRVQLHMLGDISGRKFAGHIRNNQLLDEKKQGDKYLEKIKNKSSLTKESFGLLLTILVVLKNRSQNNYLKYLSFPLPDAHPQMKIKRQENRERASTNEPALNLEYLESALDFQSMLRALGIPEECILPKGDRLVVSVEDLTQIKNYVSQNTYVFERFGSVIKE